jgi:hypothetical protein
MVNFQSFGSFWKVLEWKNFISFMTIWCTLRKFALFYNNLFYFLLILFIILFNYHPRFGIFYFEKSGNSGQASAVCSKQVKTIPHGVP